MAIIEPDRSCHVKVALVFVVHDALNTSGKDEVVNVDQPYSLVRGARID